MIDERFYDIFSALLVFVIVTIFIYLSIRLGANLRKLTIAFAAFVFIHGIYHISRSLGHEFVADGILEPVSVGALILFGLVFFRIKRKKLEARS